MGRTFRIVFLLLLFVLVSTQYGWAQGSNVFDQREGAPSWVSDFFDQDPGRSFVFIAGTNWRVQMLLCGFRLHQLKQSLS